MDFNTVRKFGRTILHDDKLYLGYSASGIEFETTASTVTADIESISSGRDPEYSWIKIFINGDETNAKRIKLSRGTSTYELYSGEKNKLNIKLIKITESNFDKIGLINIKSDGEIKPANSDGFTKKILFVGDSLTAGYGTIGGRGKAFSSDYHDVTLASSYVTAKALKANYNIIAFSGNGIITQWVESTCNEKNTSHLMPAIFDYTDLPLSEALGIEPEPLNTSDFVPDLIFVNLGTNDSSYIRRIPERLDDFKLNYEKFLIHLLELYPTSKLAAAYGIDDRSLCELEKDVIDNLILKYGKDRIKYIDLPEIHAEELMGNNGHPSYNGHRIIADCMIENLKDFI